MRKTLFIIFSFLIFVVTVETGSKYYMEYRGFHNPQPTNLPDTPIGFWKDLPYKVRMNDGRVKTALENGKIILDVPYKIDSQTRRMSSILAGDANEFMVFIGCSFTFGAGVNDTETLPSQFQKITSHYRVYNYGVGAATPEEIYYRLMNIGQEELTEKKGRVVYTYFQGHILRHFYLPDFVARWGYKKPVYLQTGRKVVNLGPYEKIHPYRTFWYKLRWKSYFYRLLSDVFPDTNSEEEIKSFAQFVGKMSLEAKRLSGQRLIVVMWPGSLRPESLKEYLKEEDLDLVDLSGLDLNKLTKGNDKIPYDGHPTPAAYQIVAHKLLETLR